jgi:hypothetical protein
MDSYQMGAVIAFGGLLLICAIEEIRFRLGGAR